MLNPTKNHHAVVVGVSGSGKTTILRMWIERLRKESDVMFVLIDPKRVELADYKHLPNVIDYARDFEEIYDALEAAYTLMMTRFEKMESAGERVSKDDHVFIIVDEMAPLMQGPHRKDYLQWFNQIALLGRSAHVHLILGTQFCTQDVIPACIRDNLDNVVCLRQKNQQKYRYLLETNVRKLSGYGYAYLYSSAMDNPEKMRVEDIWDRIA